MDLGQCMSKRRLGHIATEMDNDFPRMDTRIVSIGLKPYQIVIPVVQPSRYDDRHGFWTAWYWGFELNGMQWFPFIGDESHFEQHFPGSARSGRQIQVLRSALGISKGSLHTSRQRIRTRVCPSGSPVIKESSWGWVVEIDANRSGMDTRIATIANELGHHSRAPVPSPRYDNRHVGACVLVGFRTGWRTMVPFIEAPWSKHRCIGIQHSIHNVVRRWW